MVCDYHFDGQPVTGQDMMDDLRLARVLPIATVVVMVSGEAGNSRVAEAAEAALDAYLIKPHTAGAVRQGCSRRARGSGPQGHHRRTSRRGVRQRGRDVPVAIRYPRAGLGQHVAHWGRTVAAPRQAACGAGVFDASSRRAVPWARLGVARTNTTAGASSRPAGRWKACSTSSRDMRRLRRDGPRAPRQGAPDQALGALREACPDAGQRGPPSEVRRAVLLHGDPGRSAGSTRARSTLGSTPRPSTFRAWCCWPFQFDKGDPRGLAQSWRSMTAARAGRLGSDRLEAL